MKALEQYVGKIAAVVCKDNNIFIGKVVRVQDWLIRLEKPVRIMPVPTHSGIQVIMNGVNFDPNPNNVDYMDIRVEAVIAVYPVKEGSEEYAAYVAATTNIKVASNVPQQSAGNAGQVDLKKLVVKKDNN